MMFGNRILGKSILASLRTIETMGFAAEDPVIHLGPARSTGYRTHSKSASFTKKGPGRRHQQGKK